MSASSAVTGSVSEPVQEMGVIEVQRLRESYFNQLPLPTGAPLVHIDVRKVEELRQDGRIPQTMNLPLHLLNEQHLPEDKESTRLIFSCLRGGRSLKAAQQAKAFGYKHVYSMAGGFTAWKEQRLAVDHVPEFKGQPFVKCFYDEPTGSCQYVVSCEETKEAAILDPVLDFDMAKSKLSYANADRLLAYIRTQGLNVKWILETHAHADHLSSSQYLKRKLGAQAKIAIGKGIIQVQRTFQNLFSLPETSLLADGADFDHVFETNESFALGALTGKALHVPGHTPDHLCYSIGDAVFVGDSIFMPDFGSARCDFPGGSAVDLFHSVRHVLFGLPDSTRVFVGHDYLPNRGLVYETTIGVEKATNMHFKETISESDFVQLRETRDKSLPNPKLLFPSLQVNIRAGKLPEGRSQLFPDRILFTLPVEAPAES